MYCTSNTSKGMRIQSFQSFENSNMMQPEAHQCSLKRRAFICILLKFGVQTFRYTLL